MPQVADVQDVSALPTATLQQALLACTIRRIKSGGTNISNANGNRWGWGAMTMTLFNTVVTPNSKQLPVEFVPFELRWLRPGRLVVSQRQSNHPGGVNCLFADGSVRFIKDSISRQSGWPWAPVPTAKSSLPTRTERARMQSSRLMALQHGKTRRRLQLPPGLVV